MKKVFFGLLFVVVAFSIFIGSSNSVKAQLIPANPACYNFTRDLTVGSVGTDVVALQMFLESKGRLVMPAGVPMGYFGPLAKSALASYQASVGLTASGYFGPMTRAIMVSECEGMATSQGIIVRTVSSDTDTDEMISTIAHDDVGIFTISYDVTAFDKDIYTELGTATRGTAENNTGANFIIQDAANSYSPTSTGAIRLADLTRVSGGSTTGNFVKIAAGQTAQLQLEVTFDPGHGAASSEGYRMALHSINYALTATDATLQQVVPSTVDYRTGAVSIGDGPLPANIESRFISSDADVDIGVSDIASDDKGVFEINFDVTAKGNDAYIEVGSATRGIIRAGTGVNFVIQDAPSGYANINSGNIALSELILVSGGTRNGNFVKIPVGHTASFKLTVLFDPVHISGTSVGYRLGLYSINFASTATDATEQRIVSPSSTWRTGALSIGDGSTTVNTAPRIITFPTVPRRIQTGQSVSFTWGAADAENDNLRWSYDFGNGGGGGGGGSNCTQSGLGWKGTSGTTWNTPGTYTVKATVTDCAGLSASYSFNVTVINTPTVITNSILIESPNGGEIFKAGTSVKIEFNSTAAGINHVFDLISEATGSVTGIGQKVITTSGAQVFFATIPANIPPGRYVARVCVNCELATKVSDSSDSTFRIEAASNVVPLSSKETQIANIQSVFHLLIQKLRE